MDLVNIMLWTENVPNQCNHPSNQNVPILSILFMLEHDEALCNMLAILIRRIWLWISIKDIKSVIDKSCILQLLPLRQQDMVKLGQVSAMY